MLANVTRDAAVVPALAEVLGALGRREHERAMREVLLAGRALKRRAARAGPPPRSGSRSPSRPGSA